MNFCLLILQFKRILNEVSEQRITMERRMNVASLELDELREAVEKAERLKKQSAGSLQEGKEQTAVLTSQNSALHNQKRKLELELQAIANEVEESFSEAKLAMEKSKKANYEVAVLAEDYKAATSNTDALTKQKVRLDMMIKQLQDRVAEQDHSLTNFSASKRKIAQIKYVTCRRSTVDH